MTTFVLIPGAGGAAWYWSRVVPRLEAAGHTAIAVDLPADDETAGLAEYAGLVIDAIGDRTDVALVAQSLGGFTAPLVCEATRVESVTLVNAMIPVPHETPGDWWENTGASEARGEGGGRGRLRRRRQRSLRLLLPRRPVRRSWPRASRTSDRRPTPCSRRRATSRRGRQNGCERSPVATIGSSRSSSSAASRASGSASTSTCSPVVTSSRSRTRISWSSISCAVNTAVGVRSSRGAEPAGPCRAPRRHACARRRRVLLGIEQPRNVGHDDDHAGTVGNHGSCGDDGEDRSRLHRQPRERRLRRDVGRLLTREVPERDAAPAGSAPHALLRHRAQQPRQLHRADQRAGAEPADPGRLPDLQ